MWVVKVRGILGPDPEDDKEISILNHIVRCEKDHLRYEADPRHVEKLARDLGMELQISHDSGNEAGDAEYHLG